MSATKSLDSYILLPLLSLAMELRRENCTAILFQDYENPSFDVSVFWGHLIGVQVFATFQGGSNPRSKFDIPFRTIALRRCDGLIIGTQSEIGRVLSRYGVRTSKVARIYNPIDVKEWHVEGRINTRSKLNIPISAQVVAYHGRIDINQKGLDILLSAWAQINAEHTKSTIVLLLVGTGKDDEELHRLIAHMKFSNVIWVNNFVHNISEIRSYLSAADVYTLPSRHEGFPVAPLEAMACELPVVACDAPGIQDIFEKGEASGGIIVPRENPTSLAKAIYRFLDDDILRRETGLLGRKRLEECFSLEIVGEQLRNFLLKSNNSFNNDKYKSQPVRA